MATLFNTKISATYPGLIKTIDNAVLAASLKELTDGSGNQTGVYLNTAGDLKVTNVLEWGSLKDTGENITITKLVDQADGIANNNNDTSLPTSKAVKDYVDTKFSQTDTLQEVLTFGNTTSGTDIAVSTNDDITFTDSSKILMGASSDLQIYHNGSNSYIKDIGTGNLSIQGTQVDIMNPDGSEYKARFLTDGAAELYYDNSKKLETTSTGASVTGNLVVSGTITGSGGSFLPLAGGTMTGNIVLNDSVKSIYGTSSDGLEIYHNGNSFIDESGTGDLYLRSSDNMYFQTYGSGKAWITLTENAGVDLFFNDVKKLETTSAGATVSGDLTVTGSITGSGGSFLPLAGGTMTGTTNHGDNVKSIYGVGSDLEIYSNGTDGYVVAPVDDLVLQAADDLFLYVQDGENAIIAKGDGAVELYFDNSKKLETTTNGVTVTGSFTTTGNINSGGHVYVTDGNKFIAGSGEDLQIYHDGNNSYIDEVGTGNLYIRSGNFYLQTDSNENAIVGASSAQVELYYNANKKFETTSTGVRAVGNVIATESVRVPDGKFLSSGDSNDLTLTHTGSEAIISNYTGALRIDQRAVTQSIVFRVSDANAVDTTALTISRNADASFGRDVTIAGNLTVNGTTTTINTQTLSVEDPLIELAKDNTANSLDIGFYGKYNDGTARYLGLFADASDTNRFKLFKGTTAQPTTTVDTGGTGYEYANLLLNEIEARGDLKVEDNIYITDATTTRAKIQLNSGDRDNLDIKAVSLGSTMSFYTVDTLALTLDASQNATFAGDISLADSKYLYLGTSNDLQLYHDGTDSYISNTQNEGHLIIQNGANDKDVVFKCDNGNGGLETYFYLDGSSAELAGAARYTIFPTDSYLTFGDNKYLEMFWSTNGVIRNHSGDLFIDNYADNSDIKFRSDDGTGSQTEYFRVDGGSEKVIASKNFAFTDNVKAEFGDSGDLQIFHDGSNSYITEGGTGVLAIQTNGTEIQLNSTSGEYLARFIPDSSVKLYYDNVEKLQTTGTGIEVSGTASTFAGNVAINGNATLGDGTGDDHIINGQVTQLTADALGYKLHRTGGGTSMLISATGDAELEFGTDNGSGTNTTHWTIGKDGTDNSFRISNSASLGTSDALTIDSSENATFAGGVTIQTKTSSIATGNSGTMVFADANDYPRITQTNSSAQLGLFRSGGSAGGMYIGGDAQGLGVFTESFSEVLQILQSGAIVSDSNITTEGASVVNGGGSIAAYFNGTGSSYTQGAIALNSSNADTPEARGQGVFMHNQGKDTTWYSGTRYNNADQFIIGHATGVSLNTEAARTDNAFFWIGNTGNVGVGAENPEKKLHIKAATTDATPQVLVQNSSTGDASIMYNVSGQSYIMGIDQDDSSKFKIASSGALGTTDRITLLSGGNLGVGTINPAEKVEINGSMKIGNMKFQNAAGGRIGFNRNTNDGTIYDSNFGAFQINGASGSANYLEFQSYTSGGGFAGSFSFTDGGDFGIGLNNPGDYYGDKFVVKAPDENGITLVGTGADQKQYICFADGTVGAQAYAGYVAYDHADNSMSFATSAGNERMRINGSGYIYVNTGGAEPGATQVGVRITGTQGQAFWNSANSGTTGYNHFNFYNANGAVGSIVTNGSATSYNTSSDYRLKEDLQDFNGLNLVSKIPVYDFKWKVDESRSYGVMAHELQEVLPQAVTEEKDAEEMQSVDYSKIVPLLVKSIQELKAEIDRCKQNKCECKN